MDLKSVILLEVVKNERTYRFEMPIGAPYGECYDVAFQVLGKISELSKEAVEKVAPTEDKAEVVEEQSN